METAPSGPQKEFQTPVSEPKPKIRWGYEFQQYGTALFIAGILFLAFSLYLYFRRGYYNLYIENKVFAGVAAVLLGTVLLLGPLSRFFQVFDKYLQYRKELGIVSFFLVLAHVLSSYFFLPDKFPRERFFTTGLYPFLFGLLATLLLLIIFAISNQKAMHWLGGKRWLFLQSWGVRITFILVALHVGIMKFPGWISWYQKGGGKELARPGLPGAGILVGWFILFVLLVRTGEIISQKLGKAVWYAGVVLLPLVYIFTFWWGAVRFG